MPGASREILPGAVQRPNAAVLRRLRLLRESEGWTDRRLRDYQLAQLKALLTGAARAVPYYAGLFSRVGFEPGRMTSLADLARIPLLDKDLVRRHHADLLSREADRRTLSYMTTGGSTGDPLKIWMDDRFLSLNRANTHYYLGVYGFAPGGAPSIRLHGNAVPTEVLARGEYWVLDGPRLTMSVYHISEQTCRAYVDRINEHGPAYVHAFPSAAALLCRCARRLGLRFSGGIRAVFCDSETLYPWQRKLIRETFHCRVCDIYGHTEGAAMAFSCPRSGALHFLPQIGVLELLRPDGTPAVRDGETGEIVVTGFNNAVFPFIRYRTRDIGVLRASPCPCGRRFPLLRRVEGRVQDYVYSRAGGAVPIAPALFDYQFDWSGVDRFQVRQEVPGSLEFRVVRAPGRAESARRLRERIARGFGRILAGEFAIRVRFVRSIDRTRRGKYRYIDQRIVQHV